LERPADREAGWRTYAALAWVLVAPLGAYGLAMAWTGLHVHPDVGWWAFAAGAGWSVLTSTAVSIMGESLIEDLLKAGMALGFVGALHILDSPTISAVGWGPCVGLVVPLGLRVGQRFWS